MGFELDRQIVNEKNGRADTRTVSAIVELDCNGPTVDIYLAVNAIATIKLSNDGICLAVESIKLKNAPGFGFIERTEVIVDGVKVSAKKPSN